MTTINAWHFVNETLRDGTPVPKDEEKLVFKEKPVLCERGLHASRQPFDALQYAPGETLCYVECGGEIVEDTDKLVCTERTILCRMDASDMLRYFARMQALSVIHLYPNDTDDVVFDYLMTGNKYLRAAARAAANTTASAASWAAANVAISAVVSNAASATAWNAAWKAALEAARCDFNNLVYECFGLNHWSNPNL